MHYCPFCEAELADHAVFCSQCGRILSATTTIDEARDKRRSLPVRDIEEQDTLVVRSLLATRDIEEQDTLVVRSLLTTRDIEEQDILVVRNHLATRDIEPLDVSSNSSFVSTSYHKVLGHLPMPAQRAIAVMLNRARDPKPEEFPAVQTSQQKADGSQAI